MDHHNVFAQTGLCSSDIPRKASGIPVIYHRENCSRIFVLQIVLKIWLGWKWAAQKSMTFVIQLKADLLREARIKVLLLIFQLWLPFAIGSNCLRADLKPSFGEAKINTAGKRQSRKANNGSSCLQENLCKSIKAGRQQEYEIGGFFFFLVGRRSSEASANERDLVQRQLQRIL